MKRYTVSMTAGEREHLESLVSSGKHRSQTFLNALILLGCDAGDWQPHRSTNAELAKILPSSMRKIDRLKKRFVLEGLEAALHCTRDQRHYSTKVDGDVEEHLVALSCSEQPEGFHRCTLRLLADKMVELGYIESVSHETVRRVLKKTP